MSRKKGYWIRVKNDSAYLYDGYIRTKQEIPLYEGWNLVGYTTNETRPIQTSLSSINNAYTEVKIYNATTQSYHSHNAEGGGDLHYTYPYFGYWINMNASATWTIP
jgi:hypothetical protein